MAYAYGRGDYLPGYYRGSIFSAIGNFLGTTAKVVGGAVVGGVTGLLSTGNPAGAIKGAIGGAVSGAVGATKANIQTATLAAGGSASALTPALQAQHAQALARTQPAGGSVAGTPQGRITAGVAPVLAGGMAVSPGRVVRPSGKGYYTARHLRALQAGLTRAKPRMNPFNPRALRRAARRAHAFLRMSRHLVGYYQPHAKKGKAYIKVGRKRAR